MIEIERKRKKEDISIMEENIATINAINQIHPLAIAEDRGASIYR
jgi:hypothetical protein